MDRNALQDTLLELERSGWDSLCDGTGGEWRLALYQQSQIAGETIPD